MRVVIEYRNKCKNKVRKRKTEKEMDRQNIENDIKIAVWLSCKTHWEVGTEHCGRPHVVGKEGRKIKIYCLLTTYIMIPIYLLADNW